MFSPEKFDKKDVSNELQSLSQLFLLGNYSGTNFMQILFQLNLFFFQE